MRKIVRMEAVLSENLLEINDLKMYYPITKGVIFQKKVADVKAVDGVSFDIIQGETLGLVGEQGVESPHSPGNFALDWPSGGTVTFMAGELTEARGRIGAHAP